MTTKPLPSPERPDLDLNSLEVILQAGGYLTKRERQALFALARRAQPEGEAPQAEKQLYTCKGKGGQYEIIGGAVGAGSSRQVGSMMVYRDISDGGLYYRTLSDFDTRMEALPAAQQAESGTQAANPEFDKACGAFYCENKRLPNPIELYEMGKVAAQSQGAQQAAAPGALDADEMTRLRRLMRAIGWDHERDESDRIVRGTLFAVLGRAADKLEQAAPSAPGTPEAPKGGA